MARHHNILRSPAASVLLLTLLHVSAQVLSTQSSIPRFIFTDSQPRSLHPSADNALSRQAVVSTGRSTNRPKREEQPPVIFIAVESVVAIIRRTDPVASVDADGLDVGRDCHARSVCASQVVDPVCAAAGDVADIGRGRLRATVRGGIIDVVLLWLLVCVCTGMVRAVSPWALAGRRRVGLAAIAPWLPPP